MSVFDALAEEIGRRNSSSCTFRRGHFKGYECLELTLLDGSRDMRVVLVGETVQATEHGLIHGIDIWDLWQKKFLLADPDSVERLLLFLDLWVEKRK